MLLSVRKHFFTFKFDLKLKTTRTYYLQHLKNYDCIGIKNNLAWIRDQGLQRPRGGGGVKWIPHRFFGPKI